MERKPGPLDQMTELELEKMREIRMQLSNQKNGII